MSGLRPPGHPDVIYKNEIIAWISCNKIRIIFPEFASLRAVTIFVASVSDMLQAPGIKRFNLSTTGLNSPYDDNPINYFLGLKITAIMTKKQRRILVVDDNEDSAEVTAILLRSEGHEVIVAHTGPDAIKQVSVALPDVLLLDIGLPDMDGYDLARQLRKLPETRHAVLIALTGYGRPEDLQQSKIAGFDHHLLKPIEPSALIDLIALLR